MNAYMDNSNVTHLLDDYYITEALRVLEYRLRNPKQAMHSSDDVKKYLTLRLATLEHESFGVIFLDVQNRLIDDKILFRGTLGHVSVYPREVVKEALLLNAQSVVIYHNHPSGEMAPTCADFKLTHKIAEALKTVDIVLNDHLIVAGLNIYSFSEHDKL